MKTIDDVFARCPSGPLTGARRKQLEFLAIPGEGVGRAAIKVWITDFLLKELPDKQSGILLWAGTSLTGIRDATRRAVDWLTRHTDPESREPAPTLAVMGGRYVACSQLGGLFDLETGEPFRDNVPAVFETRIFNLRALRSACERTKQWTNKPDGSGGTPKAPPSAS